MSHTKFIIAGLQRTGTTLIRDTLGKHADVHTFGEVFLFSKGKIIKRKDGLKVPNNYRKYIEASPKRRLNHILRKNNSVKNYLHELYSKPGYQALGFKLMLSQLKQFPMLKDILTEEDIRVIHVTRENVLNTFLSRKLVRARKMHHTTKKVPLVKVKLNTRTLISRLDKIQQDNQEWKDILVNNQYIHTTYESFTQDKANELGRLFAFLNIEPDYSVSSDFVKMNPFSMEEIISNYNDVRACLSGTQHEHFIN